MVHTASDQSSGQLIPVVMRPVVPPCRQGNDRATIGDTAANNNICSLFEGLYNAPSPKVSHTAQGSVTPALDTLPRIHNNVRDVVSFDKCYFQVSVTMMLTNPFHLFRALRSVQGSSIANKF